MVSRLGEVGTERSVKAGVLFENVLPLRESIWYLVIAAVFFSGIDESEVIGNGKRKEQPKRKKDAPKAVSYERERRCIPRCQTVHVESGLTKIQRIM